MRPTRPDRRAFLASAVFTSAALPALARSTPSNGGFEYEVAHTPEEWRAMLSDAEYAVMRGGETEEPHSSPLAREEKRGEYYCRGCKLHAYTSEWKVPLDKGWVFFAHAQPNAVLMDIDLETNYAMSPDSFSTAIEAHCRRCGSHLGHILTVQRVLVHCINGLSLSFKPATA